MDIRSWGKERKILQQQPEALKATENGKAFLRFKAHGIS